MTQERLKAMSDLVKENLENLEKSQEKQTGMIRGQEFDSLRLEILYWCCYQQRQTNS